MKSYAILLKEISLKCIPIRDDTNQGISGRGMPNTSLPYTKLTENILQQIIIADVAGNFT